MPTVKSFVSFPLPPPEDETLPSLLLEEKTCNCRYTCIDSLGRQLCCEASNNDSVDAIKARCSELHKCTIIDVVDEKKLTKQGK